MYVMTIATMSKEKIPSRSSDGFERPFLSLCGGHCKSLDSPLIEFDEASRLASSDVSMVGKLCLRVRIITIVDQI